MSAPSSPDGSSSRRPDQPDLRDRRGFLALGAGLASCPLLACRSATPEDDVPAEPLEGRAQDERHRLDELFAHLTDQSHTVEPIVEFEREARRKRLGQLLDRAGYQAFLCEGGPTMRYLSGIDWGRSERLFALIVLADGGHLWLCPAFEESRARRRIDADDGPGGDVVTWQEHEYAFAPLSSVLRARRVGRLALDPALRLFAADGIAASVGREDVSSAPDILLELRGRKGVHELELLRKASVLTQRALRAVSERLEPGISGTELGAMVRRAQERLGLRRVWVLPLFGPASAYPHGGDVQTLLAPGDMILIDTGGSLHEYQSDTTRSWVFDRAPDAEQSRAWFAVRDAQRRAFQAIGPGKTCAEIDRVARDSLTDAGYGPGYEHFTHRLGHGIGMEGHEAPYFDGGSTVTLAPGMTLSNEPGVYMPGRFGVRLEDIVEVTDDGADHFGTWQKGPEGP